MAWSNRRREAHVLGGDPWLGLVLQGVPDDDDDHQHEQRQRRAPFGEGEQYGEPAADERADVGDEAADHVDDRDRDGPRHAEHRHRENDEGPVEHAKHRLAGVVAANRRAALLHQFGPFRVPSAVTDAPTAVGGGAAE